jgi:hypothetical protein
VLIFDELYRRMYNFLFSCLNSDSCFIRSVVLRGLCYGGSISPIARNAIFCSLHWHMKFTVAAFRKMSAGLLRSRFLSGLSGDSLSSARCLMEAMLIRDGRLKFPDPSLSRADIQALIDALCCSCS